MNIDKTKALTLIQLANYLDEGGSSLYEYDYQKYLELDKFTSCIKDTLTYQRKRQFIKLLRRLSTNRISVTGFIYGFEKLSLASDQDYATTRQDFEKLIILQINQEAVGFQKDIISNIYLACEQFRYQVSELDPDWLSELDFRTFMDDLLFEIQVYQYN